MWLVDDDLSDVDNEDDSKHSDDDEDDDEDESGVESAADTAGRLAASCAAEQAADNSDSSHMSHNLPRHSSHKVYCSCFYWHHGLYTLLLSGYFHAMWYGDIESSNTVDSFSSLSIICICQAEQQFNY